MIPIDIVRIRRAEHRDAALLAAIAERTFVETFGPQNTPEDMALHVASTFGALIQARELADPEVTYLVAEVDGATAGFAMVRAGEAPPCVTGPDPVEIQRLYVDAPWHGRGVAQRLMSACEDEARRRGGRTLWLGVWERNPRAQRFYSKCGFEFVGSHVFVVGNDPQTDLVMVRPL